MDYERVGHPPPERLRRFSSVVGGLGASRASNWATQGPSHDVDDLVDVAICVAVRGGRSDATLDVVLEDEHRQGIDGGAQGARLLEDVHAVLLALDHPADPAHLALDAGEAAHELRLVAGVAVPEVVGVLVGAGLDGWHPAHDTPRGYRRQGSRPTVSSRPTGYTPVRMDPLDHLLALPDGLRCTVCDERVPATRIRLLAWRDDLAFLQIDCQGCASTTLGFVLGGRSEEAEPEAEPDPISSDDVLDMHEFLATWRGDLAALLTSSDAGRAESSR